MIPFLLGFCAGSVSAVVSPKLYRWVADKVAEAKDKISQ